MIRSQHRRGQAQPLTPLRQTHHNKQNTLAEKPRPSSSYEQILQEVKQALATTEAPQSKPTAPKQMQAKHTHARQSQPIPARQVQTTAYRQPAPARQPQAPTPRRPDPTPQIRLEPSPLLRRHRPNPQTTPFVADQSTLKHALEPSTMNSTFPDNTLPDITVDMSNYYSRYHPNTCVRHIREKQNEFKVKARNIREIGERVAEMLSRFKQGTGHQEPKFVVNKWDQYQESSERYSLLQVPRTTPRQPRQLQQPQQSPQSKPFQFQHSPARPPVSFTIPSSPPAQSNSILQQSSLLHSFLPPIQHHHDQQLQQDIINAYNRQLQQQQDPQIIPKCTESHIFAVQASQLREDSVYASCMQDIEREIRSVRQRIGDSERWVSEMRGRYLQGRESGGRESRGRESRGCGGVGAIKIVEAVSDGWQYMTSIKESQSRYGSNRSGVQDIGVKIACLLATQMDYDRQLRQARQHFSQLPEQLSCQSPQSKWQLLLETLKASGSPQPLTILIPALTITSLQLDPFLPASPSPPATLISTLAQAYQSCQQHWHCHILHSIPRHEAKQQQFSPSSLDMDNKGYISVEDLVCYVNMCSGKLYRVRDAVQVLRRLGGEGVGWGIGYGDLEAVLFAQ